MSRRQLTSVIWFFLLIMIGQGYFIYKNYRNRPDYTEKHKNKFEKKYNYSALMNELTKKIKKDINSTGDIFDKFFNDEFFDKYDTPFNQIEKLRKQIFEDFGENNHFSKSWDNWYSNKFGVDDINVITEAKNNKVIMKFRIPGLKNNTLNVDINNKRIRVECDVKETTEKSDDKGMKYFSSSSHSHFFRMFPAPKDVDVSSAEIKTKGNEIIITFLKIR